MVLEEVGVFVEVDCFQRELAQPFASVGVCGGLRGDAAAAEGGSCAVLEGVSDFCLLCSGLWRRVGDDLLGDPL